MSAAQSPYAELAPAKRSFNRGLLVMLGLGLVMFGAGGFLIGHHIASSASTPAAPIGCFPPGQTEGQCPYRVPSDLNGDLGATLSGTPYAKGSTATPEPFARRVEYEVVTVDDMQLAMEFYEGVLGAVPVNFCAGELAQSPFCSPDGVVSFHGDGHSAALFSAELLHGEGGEVPDITARGGFEVRTRFLVLGNGVLQLMKFANRTSGEHFDLREPLTSPCWIGAGHIDFWINDDLDMNDYIVGAEAAAAARNMSNVAWNRPVPQQTRADRAKVPQSQYANKVPTGPAGGAFGGLEWSYFKGPVGEQLELYKITGAMKDSVGRAYCDRGAVSSAFVQSGASRDSARPITQQLHGVFQYGYRTDDLHAAVGFYTEVMGGDLITYPTHGLDITGDDAHWMILANETIEAFERAEAQGLSREEAMRALGVANISTGGTMRLDHRFILFDNFVVEPLFYTDGLSFGGDVYAPRWNHSTSPAFIGAVGAAFGVPASAASLQEAMGDLRARAHKRGYHTVYIPDQVTPAQFASDHPLQGLEYVYGKGQAGEALAFVRIGGRFAQQVEAVMQEAGGVSTRFESTDVFKRGLMDSYCASLASA